MEPESDQAFISKFIGNVWSGWGGGQARIYVNDTTGMQ